MERGYSTLDIMLDETKVKFIQLSCFSDVNQQDWMNNPVRDLIYLPDFTNVNLSEEEIEKFIRLAPSILGSDVRKPKFLTFEQWINQGGRGLKTLFAIYYIDRCNKDQKILVLYHFESFHPLAYSRFLYYLCEDTLSDQIILLSTNATTMLDMDNREGEPTKFKKFIQLNDGDKIIDIEKFIKMMGRTPEKSYMYNVEKMYRDYCKFGGPRPEKKEEN